jgi:hypothetical protein
MRPIRSARQIHMVAVFQLLTPHKTPDFQKAPHREDLNPRWLIMWIIIRHLYLNETPGILNHLLTSRAQMP